MPVFRFSEVSLQTSCASQALSGDDCGTGHLVMDEYYKRKLQNILEPELNEDLSVVSLATCSRLHSESVWFTGVCVVNLPSYLCHFLYTSLLWDSSWYKSPATIPTRTEWDFPVVSATPTEAQVKVGGYTSNRKSSFGHGAATGWLQGTTCLPKQPLPGKTK